MLKKLKQNWKSGLTVSLVSIPLSVSLAVASGANPTMGIITAIWAGLIASIFGGSNYNIVGPTGALSGILATFAITQGYELLPVLAILSGVVIFIAYILRFEKYLIFVPASTIHGFTLGVAFIIGLNQLNYAFGLQGLKVHEKFIDNLFESLGHIQNSSPTAIIIFVAFLLALFGFKKFFPKLPGSIILAPVGILLGFFSVIKLIPIQIITLGDKFPSIEPTLFQAPKLALSTEMIVPVLTISIVAILETMISAKIADGMTKTKHNKRKEMLGLSLANIASGFAGGMPATAALARTSLNVKTGATSNMSATISSVAVVLISFILLSYYRFIPMAVIASILVFVAINMVEVEHFKAIFRLDKLDFVVAFIVAFVTIYEDPIVGILFGTAVSLIFFMEKLSRGQYEMIANQKDEKTKTRISTSELKDIKESIHTLVYSIKGQLAYINGQAHIARFEQKLNKVENVVLRLRELYFIDIDGIEALDEIIEILEARGINVYITGLDKLIETEFSHSKQYQKLKADGHVYSKTSEVLAKLGYSV
jgi:SulP family sulfate permease